MASKIHDLTYYLKESSDEETEDLSSSEKKQSSKIHDLTYYLKESSDEETEDLSSSEKKQSSKIHDLTYYLKESSDEETEDLSSSEKKQSSKIHDLTYYLKESSDEETEDLSSSEKKQSSKIHDLTYYLKESSDEETEDLSSSEKKQSSKIHDLTYYLKESSDEETEDLSSSEKKQSSKIHDLTYYLKESSDEETEDLTSSEKKQSSKIHDLTYYLKESSDEETEDLSFSEKKQSSKFHDLTYFLKDSSDEETEDLSSSEKKQSSKLHDLTYYLKDSSDEETEDLSSSEKKRSSKIRDLTYFLKDSSDEETEDLSSSEKKQSSKLHDLTYFLKDSSDEETQDLSSSKSIKSSEIRDLTYFLKESSDEETEDLSSSDMKQSSKIHDFTYFMKDSSDEETQDLSYSQKIKSSKIHDLTYFLKDSSDEETQDVSSSEKKQYSSNKTLIINDQISNLIEKYDAEIPTEKKEYRLFPDKIRADLMNSCPCKEQCSEELLKDENVVSKVQHLRSKFFSCNQGQDRTNRLVDLMQNTICSVDVKKKRCHIFQGHIICCHKFCDLLNLSSKTYYRALWYVKNDVMEVDNFRKNPCHNVRGLGVVGFFENFISDYGDFSPEREVILMPDCINIKYMFDEYTEGPGPHVTKRHFYRLFSEKYGKVVSFAKTKNINPCDICMKVKIDLFKIKDQHAKHLLKRDLKVHLDRQRKERMDYYRKREEASKKPNEALSIIIDGMDQSKTNLPHFKGWTRPKSGAPALKTHVTGVLVHGKRDNFYIDLLQWPHCPNLTISCLAQAICDGKTCLPPKIYVQCDNCGRENKNKYVIGFLGYLCLAGYVQEAYLSFLIKGHTHEDVDQRFSKISHRLRKVHAFTLPSLKTEVEKSFIKTPNVQVLGCIWDVKTWLDGTLNVMSNHSYQHQFWLYCDRPNHVVLRYRRFSTDDWMPGPDDNHLELFSLNAAGDHNIPTGMPKYSTPDFEDTRMECIKSSIQKMKNFLSFEDNAWWQDFLKNPVKAVKKNIRWPFSSVRKVHKNGLTHSQPPAGNSSVTEMIETEQTSREVMVRRKRRRSE